MSPFHLLLIASLAGGGGLYVHRSHNEAQAVLAEAQRINAEAQERLRRVEKDQAALAAERQAHEQQTHERQQQLAAAETRLRNETAIADAAMRQAEAQRNVMALERQRIEQGLHESARAQRQIEEGRQRLMAENLQAARQPVVVTPPPVIWSPPVRLPTQTLVIHRHERPPHRHIPPPVVIAPPIHHAPPVHVHTHEPRRHHVPLMSGLRSGLR